MIELNKFTQSHGMVCNLEITTTVYNGQCWQGWVIQITSQKGKLMKRFGCLFLLVILLCACAPSRSKMQAAMDATATSWTPVPSQTPYPTYTPQPTVMITKVVYQTPVPSNTDDCVPIKDMNYENNSKAAIKLQSYVGELPDVQSVSITVPEKLYSNTISQLYYVQYTNTEGDNFAKRYIVYMKEFGWKNGVFSIDGQCWINGPK